MSGVLEHPAVATSLGNLALVLGDLGEPAAARPLLDRALAITEAAYGPEHPAVATSLGKPTSRQDAQHAGDRDACATWR